LRFWFLVYWGGSVRSVILQRDKSRTEGVNR
jgi:hypothetical protein